MSALSQSFFVPAPTLTEKNLPDQSSRVFIVTGGYTGVGKELSRILYRKNGTVYIAGRTKSKYDAAEKDIKDSMPNSKGRLEFLQLDLADLSTIKASADEFISKEQRLDVLTNNAGVMFPPAGSKTPQNHELTMGTNCLGPYLFTSLLTPLLQKTAATSPPGSVRVTWAASLGTQFSPKGGIDWDPKTSAPKIRGPQEDYMQTKAANVFLSREMNKRFYEGQEHGVVSNAWNPGNLKTELQRHSGSFFNLLVNPILHEAKFGAYTELWAGWAEEPGRKENVGRYVGPWGRFVNLRKDVDEGKEAGRFWEWCEEETKQFK